MYKSDYFACLDDFESGWLEAIKWRDSAPVVQPVSVPIDMLLFCPKCHVQHIDGPEHEPGRLISGGPNAGRAVPPRITWENPPHRSHLCHACGFIWRPADVPTNGVVDTKTHGTNDSSPMELREAAAHQAADSVAIPAAEPVAWPMHQEAVAIYKDIRAQAHENPIGFIEQSELVKLGDSVFGDAPESHVRLWHPGNPPSRALIPVYAAPAIPLADAQRTDAEGLTDAELLELRLIARIYNEKGFPKHARAFLAARPASSAQPVMTTDPWDELIRVLTEYEGALQEQDEEEIAPAREALIAFLKPYRAHIEAA